MVVAAVLCVLLAVALVGVVAAYEWELRSLGRWLEGYEPGSNGRPSVGFGTPGLRRAVAGVARLLDEVRDGRERDLLERKAFRSGLASLSHDIRTPLAGAKGYLELYETRADQAARERCVREARGRLDAMHRLVDDLFEYTRAVEGDRGPLPTEPVEVYPLVARALLGMYPAFEERGWEPAVDFEDEGATVVADPQAFSRVVANLVKNALDHGVGPLRVVQRGRTVSFSNAVENPAGLEVDRLFERFYRADPARGGASSGLGLAIVAQLCAAMGIGACARLESDELTVELRLPG